MGRSGRAARLKRCVRLLTMEPASDLASQSHWNSLLPTCAANVVGTPSPRAVAGRGRLTLRAHLEELDVATRELQRMLLGRVSAASSWDVLFEKRGCDE